MCEADGTPNGYSFISFKGTEYIIDWKVSGSPADHQMNIYVPRGIVAGSEDETLLMVDGVALKDATGGTTLSKSLIAGSAAERV